MVLAVASGRDQLRDTELLLQYWESRAITCRGKTMVSNVSNVFLWLDYYLIRLEAAFTVSVTKQEAFPLLGRRADPLLKVGGVSDVEHIVDVHGQR